MRIGRLISHTHTHTLVTQNSLKSTHLGVAALLRVDGGGTGDDLANLVGDGRLVVVACGGVVDG